MYKVRRNLFGSYGAMVIANGAELEELKVEFVLDLMKSHGVVMFRDFKSGIPQFKAFSDRFSSDFFIHFNRAVREPIMGNDRTLTSAQTGNGPLFLHGEMYYFPVQPDIVWLHCSTPPATHGETTVCDGAKFLASLSESTQKLLRENRIRYSYQLPRKWWELGCEAKTVDEAIRDLKNRWKINAKFEVMADQSLKFDHVTSAIRKSRYGNEDVFINSIANLTQYPGVTTLSLEDGRDLPKDIIDEVIQTGERIADFIQWQEGDIAMVDNSRILHGRRAFSCPRKVETRFSKVA